MCGCLKKVFCCCCKKLDLQPDPRKPREALPVCDIGVFAFATFRAIDGFPAKQQELSDGFTTDADVLARKIADTRADRRAIAELGGFEYVDAYLAKPYEPEPVEKKGCCGCFPCCRRKKKKELTDEEALAEIAVLTEGEPDPEAVPETVRARPGRLSGLSVSHSKSVLYGVFVWARRVLNSPKRWFPARAGGTSAGGVGRRCGRARRDRGCRGRQGGSGRRERQGARRGRGQQAAEPVPVG
jgi:hypothetical protein